MDRYIKQRDQLVSFVYLVLTSAAFGWWQHSAIAGVWMGLALNCAAIIRR
jgi:hypothetical protein